MGLLGAGIPTVVDFLMIGETVLAVLLAVSYMMGKKHLGRQHHFVMMSAFAVDTVIFKPVMFLRAFDGSNGYFPWNGAGILLHFFAAMIVTIIGAIVISLSLRDVARKGKKMFMPSKGNKHRMIGRVFLLLWFLSYAVGVFIFTANWL